jgi:hypothetical protein
MRNDLTPPAETEAPSFAVYAVIRPSSKYAHQGRESGKQVAMKVARLDAGDEYAFHLENGNRYRREDLTFYVRNHDGKFIKLR